MPNKLTKKLNKVINKVDKMTINAKKKWDKMPRSQRRIIRGVAGKVVKTIVPGVGALIGSGKYKLNRNSARIRNNISSVNNDYGNIFTRSELLGGITSNSTTKTFKLTSEQITPMNNTLFPWLSGIAVRYQEYRFLSLSFRYIPAVGNIINGADNTLGQVGLASLTNLTYSDPTSLSAFGQISGHVTDVPSKPVLLAVECNNTAYRWYRIDQSNNYINDPQYSFAKLLLCSDNIVTTSQMLGYIEVTYSIELRKPMLPVNFTPYANFTATSTSGQAYLFNTSGVVETSTSNLDYTISSNALTFDSLRSSGNFQVTIYANDTGPAVAWTAVNTTGSTNISVSTILQPDTGAVTDGAVVFIQFSITKPGASLVVQNLFATNGCTYTLRIVQTGG